MISIIISSVNKQQLIDVKKNIEQTIGVPYELIAIDNSSGEKGVCEVYNAGAKLAQYDIFCFMHEDVKIHTNNWGVILHKIFCENSELGLVGIAGSQYKALTPSSWNCYDINTPNAYYFNLIQDFKYDSKEKTISLSNPTDVRLARVASIDGVWMCCSRQSFQSYHFDEKLLKGFHGYDVDFSLGMNQNYEVAVTFEILIEHFSEGNFDAKWLKDILKVHKKWNYMLPLNFTNITEYDLIKDEKRAFKNVLKKMWKLGFKSSDMQSAIYNSRQSRIFNFPLILKLYSQLFKLLFKNRN